MEDLARFYKALADESRLRMLWLLFQYDELCVCEIMATLGITQSKASRHLAALRHAGLVTGRKEGLWSHYRLRNPLPAGVRVQVDALRAGLSDLPESRRLLRKSESCLTSRMANKKGCSR